MGGTTTRQPHAPHEDHLRLEVPAGVVLLDTLPEVHQQLLQLVVLNGDAEPNDRHQQLGHVFAVQDHEHALHGAGKRRQ